MNSKPNPFSLRWRSWARFKIKLITHLTHSKIEIFETGTKDLSIACTSYYCQPRSLSLFGVGR